METEKEKEKLGEALLKVALGYQLAEITEEYAEVDGKLKLTKRKRTKKDVPPDLKAVQLLLAENGGGTELLSDEELEAEKKRLLQILLDNEISAGHVRDECEEEVALDASKKKRKPRAKPRKRVVRKLPSTTKD